MNKNIKSMGINELSKQELTHIEGGVTAGPNGGCTPTIFDTTEIIKNAFIIK
jgi:bacteriocin-like protein